MRGRAAPSLPGAEAYADRHARTAAIPLEHRSRDVHTFLEAHQLLDQAAAVLSSSTASENERVVAVLQCATTTFSCLAVRSVKTIARLLLAAWVLTAHT